MSGREPDAETRFAVMALAALALLPAAAPDWQLSEFARYFAYMVLAASLAWVWGHCGLLCLGQAVFFGIGAYAMSVVTLGMLPFAPALLSSWVGMALGVGVATLSAWLLGRVFFSARGLGGPFFGIVTLAVAFIVERVAINWGFLGGLNGLMNVPALRIGLNGGREIVDETTVYYAMLGILAAVVALLIAVARSRWGRVLLAIRNHELRAQALGVDIAREKTRAFALGAAVAALAGALFVTQFSFASPPLIGFTLSAEALIWVAVGGRNSIVAAALGALLVRLAEAWLSKYVGDNWLLALGVAFVLVVVAMPRGVVGELIARTGARPARARGGAASAR
ncbi:MAG: branched-chain amino acid ABC transporter permease [Burkholderiaceae bacterium]|nr:branched-chain amino acid ABC transporter permease [Burkholderiaceae bacterium]MEB2351884.1 branched-chain amino acid ABC transporter permease [Burkholderiaceae bacterium]